MDFRDFRGYFGYQLCGCLLFALLILTLPSPSCSMPRTTSPGCSALWFLDEFSQSLGQGGGGEMEGQKSKVEGFISQQGHFRGPCSCQMAMSTKLCLWIPVTTPSHGLCRSRMETACCYTHWLPIHSRHLG